MARLVTNIIRDKDGKLVATYETASSAAQMPDDIAIRFGGVTKEQLNQLKQNPNYAGVPISGKYTMESLIATDPSYYYKNELTDGTYARDQKAYAEKYEALQKEAQQRRDFESNRIAEATQAREAAAANIAVKNRFLAHTTGNPFVAPGAREISRRKAKGAVDSFNAVQFELGDSIDSYNALTFQGAFENYNKERELAKYNQDRGLNTYGGYDNKHNDYSTGKLFSVAEQPKTEAQINQEKYQALKAPSSGGYSGLQITGLENLPNKLTREQSQQVNQSLIKAQVPHIIEDKILSQIPSETKRAGKREQINNFLATPQKVEGGLFQTAYAETPQTRVSFGSGGIDKIKQAVAEAKVIGPVTLSYVDQNNVERKVAVKNANEAVRKIYDETKNGSTKFSISAQTPQGPQKGNTGYFVELKEGGGEKGIGIPGSLGYVFGKEKEIQGPNLNDNAFFVGVNAQGYTIDTTRKIEARPTATDFFGNNWYFRKLDAIYETNKPISERSDKHRPGPLGFSNREIGEVTAYSVNRLIDINNFFTKEKELSHPLGNPFAKVIDKNPSPRIETTLDKLAQGKSVDLTDKNQRFSLYGSALGIAGELYLFNKGLQGGAKAQQAVGDIIQTSKVQKAAQLTNEGKIFGTTKLDDNTFIITRGTEGGTVKVSEKISPSLIIERTQNRINAFFSKTPKEVNTLSNGQKIQESIAKIDDKINELKVFTDSSKYGKLIAEKNKDKIKLLELEREKQKAKLESALFPGQAQYPVSVVEFNNPSPAFPKGNIFTEFGKATPIKDTPIGSKVVVTGQVSRQNLFDLGLKEIQGFTSKEFGIAQKSNPFYIGTLTEKNISKLKEAENLGFIKSIATGKSAPLEAILKKQGDILGEYAGVQRATTRIKEPVEDVEYFYHGTSKIIGDNKIPSILSKDNNPIIKLFQSKQPTKEIKPVISQYIDAPSKGFGSPDVLGIVDSKVLPRGVTGIGSKGLDRLLSDVGLSTAKGTTKEKFGVDAFGNIIPSKGKTSRPFDFNNIAESKGIGGSSGKGANITVEEARKAATNYLSTRPVATPQDILFSPPRLLPPQAHGEIYDNVLAFPQGTPERIKNQVKIESGLETRITSRQTQSGEGDYFNRFGLEMFKPTKKEFEKQQEIPLITPRHKTDQRIKAVPIQGIGQFPILTPRIDTTQIQGAKLKTDLVTDLITTTTTIPDPVPIRTPPGITFGGFGFAFPGFGGGRGSRAPRKKYKKKYIVSSIDPLTPGSIITAGVEQQRVSSSKRIYKQLDVSLGKARKKNQPKGKRSKHAIPDPFG